MKEFPAVAVIIPTPGRGRTLLQWRLDKDQLSEIIAELRTRFGAPLLESVLEGGVLDEIQAAVDSNGRVIHLTGGVP